MARTGSIWRARKRNALGLPWTFTIYELTNDRLFITTGILNKREDEVRLYRITDISLTKSLWQRILGMGTIHLDSSDQSLKNFELINVKTPDTVKEQISQLVEAARLKNRVYARENMNGYDIPGDADDDGVPDIAEGPGPEDH